jgi:D-glycero-alpha-D-manno-heptose-7-phosphate kinase
MIIASCPLRVSLFGGSTDNPHFVEKYGYGSVISFACDLKTYVTLTQDKFGLNRRDHKYVINYSKREEVNTIDEIQNEVVRTVLTYFDMPPVQITLTSDAYSQGSGLASSSSYLISLIKACCMFLEIEKTDTEICALAYILELKFNPYCGYQDPYGCGVGGFKRIEFYDINTIKYEYLSTHLFDYYDAYLVFTGVTRNSNKTTSAITSNEHIQEMDQVLSESTSVISHKLCGAGNGGFFLTFSERGNLSIPYDCVKIKVVSEGVRGKSI